MQGFKDPPSSNYIQLSSERFLFWHSISVQKLKPFVEGVRCRRTVKSRELLVALIISREFFGAATSCMRGALMSTKRPKAIQMI